jgi:hypothetical protein
LLVVSDTTAITSLLKIQRAELLARLFGDVLISEAVRDELLRYHQSIPEFLQVRTVASRGLLPTLLEDLDRGEAESIALAVEIQADALLIDERRGRRIAEAHGVPCLGLAGALLLAKRRGLVSSVRAVLDDLERDSRLFLSPELKREVIGRAGE